MEPRQDVSVESVVIRLAQLRDLDAVATMCHALWPDSSAEDHARYFAPVLAGDPPGILPAVILVAETQEGRIAGFVEVGLRSHANGCDPSRPVGFVEGWFVDVAHRRRKVGAQLIAAAEDWARSKGCVEMASDTWIESLDSQRAHEALGYEVADRCVNYRKRL